MYKIKFYNLTIVDNNITSIQFGFINFILMKNPMHISFLEWRFSGKDISEPQLCISITLKVFHLDISGNDDNDLQFLNIHLIYLTLFVFHLDTSGNDDNDSHPLNIPFISVTLLVFHLDISGKDNNDEQLKNIEFILITLLIYQLDISGNDNNDEQPQII